MNYYELLGIDSNATDEEISRAYKIQMKKWHPDVNKDEEAMSISMKINEAKDILLDPVKRKEYDDFIKHKNDSTYKKYSNVKTGPEYNAFNKEYESRKVTKWEYLKDYLHSNNIGLFKKIITFILVALESFVCFILKYLIIGIAFLCFFLSDMIITFFNLLYPLVLLIIAVLLVLWGTSGTDAFFSKHMNKVILFLIIIGIYASSYLLIFIGKKLISQKVFNFLYNKLDVYLFKKAVGYN